jgi:hypothetical protein
MRMVRAHSAPNHLDFSLLVSRPRSPSAPSSAVSWSTPKIITSASALGKKMSMDH